MFGQKFGNETFQHREIKTFTKKEIYSNENYRTIKSNFEEEKNI